MASGIWKSFAPWTDHFIIVDYSTLNQLELVTLIGDEDALETALWSKVVVITHAFQEVEETIGRIDLLQCQNRTVHTFYEPFLN
jgi:hypothetical protein